MCISLCIVRTITKQKHFHRVSFSPTYQSTTNVRKIIFVCLFTAQKMKFSIKDFFSRCDQIANP